MKDLRGQLPTREAYSARDVDGIVGVTLHYTAGGTFATAVDIATFQISDEAIPQTGAGVPFPGIAYTILVTGDGVANLCHDLDRRTWHSGAVINGQSRNNTHIGICYTGAIQPNRDQIVGIAEAIAFCQEELGRELTIEGHRDAPHPTDCPGPIWPTWEEDVLVALRRPPTWEELEAENPNIRDQRDNWQEARRQVGQDPFSWPDFRSHLIAIGAPDPGPVPPDSFAGGSTAPTFEELRAQNPNFGKQLNDWVRARGALGQDFTDWGAFRAHLIAIGAPDPGPQPPFGWSG